jgi:5'-nucleotidase
MTIKKALACLLGVGVLAVFGAAVDRSAFSLVGTTVDAAPRETVELQFLTISDWHAQLDPLVEGAQQIAGAAVLSAYFQQERAANPHSLTLTAGDAYGASPPLSSFFDEDPAIRAMNLMGFDADTLGNHNFDRGLSHL